MKMKRFFARAEATVAVSDIGDLVRQRGSGLSQYWLIRCVTSWSDHDQSSAPQTNYVDVGKATVVSPVKLFQL